MAEDSATGKQGNCCKPTCATTTPDESRRRFLKTSLGSAVAAAYGDLALNPKMVFAAPQQDFSDLIPTDKGLNVLVVTDKGLVEQRYVVLGPEEETAIVVEEGLREGESVIVEGLQRVRPGVEVSAVLSGTAEEN